MSAATELRARPSTLVPTSIVRDCVFAVDVVGNRLDRDLGDVLQGDLLARCRVERDLLDRVDAVAALGGAPGVDVVRLPVAEHVADLFARHEHRGGAADVARLEPVALGRVEVHRDGHLGHVALELDVLVDRPRNLGDHVEHVVGRLVQRLEVVAEHLHRDRLARPGEDLADPLLEIGLHVSTESRILVDDRLHLGQGLVVIDVVGDADPVLAEVDAVGLVGEVGLADVRAEVAHSRDRLDLLGHRLRDPHLLLAGGVGLRHPVHEEVALLEVGQELLTEPRGDQDTEEHDHRDGDEGGPGRPDDGTEHPLVGRAGSRRRSATRGVRAWRSSAGSCSTRA